VPKIELPALWFIGPFTFNVKPLFTVSITACFIPSVILAGDVGVDMMVGWLVKPVDTPMLNISPAAGTPTGSQLDPSFQSELVVPFQLRAVPANAWEVYSSVIKQTKNNRSDGVLSKVMIVFMTKSFNEF
jgi:hypothetical protein